MASEFSQAATPGPVDAPSSGVTLAIDLDLQTTSKMHMAIIAAMPHHPRPVLTRNAAIRIDANMNPAGNSLRLLVLRKDVFMADPKTKRVVATCTRQ